VRLSGIFFLAEFEELALDGEEGDDEDFFDNDLDSGDRGFLAGRGFRAALFGARAEEFCLGSRGSGAGEPAGRKGEKSRSKTCACCDLRGWKASTSSGSSNRPRLDMGDNC